jgi:hypothetical protein
MPVLSETTASSSLPGLDLPYVFIGGSLLLIIGVLISRKSKKSATTPLPQFPEKVPQENYSPPMTFPQHQHQHQHHAHHPTILSRPPQPLPFTPPTLSTTIFPAPLSPTASFTQSQPSSPGLNASYYDSPTTLEFEFPYSSTPSSEPPALTSTSTSQLPRRRSYTKTSSPEASFSSSSSSSVTVTGEIISAEGWRRHTRVFGGGVCKACEESERRMSA